MLILILIVAFILFLTVFLVVIVRKQDGDAATDQARDPFEAEPARLAAAGLLYERDDRSGLRQRKSYTITPAGEAALRTWLREPMNDPGMLRLYFAGVVGPADVVALARHQRELHRERLTQYERIMRLLPGNGNHDDDDNDNDDDPADWSDDRGDVGDDDWREAREIAELGARFEQFCENFWERKGGSPIQGREIEGRRIGGHHLEGEKQ